MAETETKAKPVEKARGYLMAALLGACCLLAPEAYVTEGTDPACAALYHFTHANAWHLALNALFILRFKPRWKSTLSGWLCASLAALCPSAACGEPTCGMSGMCYAMAARSDVWHGSPNPWLLLSNIPLALTGHFNWKIHLLSYSISYALWSIIHRKANSSPPCRGQGLSWKRWKNKGRTRKK